MLKRFVQCVECISLVWNITALKERTREDFHRRWVQKTCAMQTNGTNNIQVFLTLSHSLLEKPSPNWYKCMYLTRWPPFFPELSQPTCSELWVCYVMLQPSITAVCEIVTKCTIDSCTQTQIVNVFRDTQHDFQSNIFQLDKCFVSAPHFLSSVSSLKHNKVYRWRRWGGCMDQTQDFHTRERLEFVSCVSLFWSQTMWIPSKT